eukprot:TRINITY_DN7696_c0_g1_i1.p1 TRINITY_DN7696_c0_g1~~TRINITY_DN7696_c0_g1_i1.p1  ORF type:complete len:105 (+),score=9.18 TRINITY_DN7696_c0_g1_i1:237-551(+)
MLSQERLDSMESSHDTRNWGVDSLTLIRFSAVTFNAHRIHWDLPYSQNIEGYPNLVVHGHLTTSLMLKHFVELYPDLNIVEFEYRAMAPTFLRKRHFKQLFTSR